PDHLVDLNGLEELSYIRQDGATIEIGAMTRQRDIEFAEVIAEQYPLISEAIRHVGHRQTRNRGTIGGSLCHLDPAAELPLVACALDAEITVASLRGNRIIPMAEFAASYMTPAIEPDEVVAALRIRSWSEGHGFGFEEFARRQGDFAIVAVAVLLEIGAGDVIRRAAVAIGGIGATPLRMAGVEEKLVGERTGPELFQEAAQLCAEIEAIGDVHSSADYRRHLAKVLAGRALSKAHRRATPLP
ncbi:MAG: FAD binding domain-containing protein, partial [Alphaproteobacteria bacterium]|nr:FAD binding domain-containing protein [Alphaproteobacteria bacterium]